MSRLSGSITYSDYDYDAGSFESKSTNIGITPSFSFLITDNLEIGGELQFEYYEDEMSGGSYTYRAIDREYYAAAAARYYIHTGKFYPFAGASFGYRINKSGSNDVNTTQILLSVGVEYFIAKNAAIEPLISYRLRNSDDYDSTILTVGIGVNYFIEDLF